MLGSHDEVNHYLRSQAQTSAVESTTSESLQDTVPARGHHVSTGGVCSLCDLLLFVHYSSSNHNSDCWCDTQVGEHRDGLDEHGSSSGVLEERVSQDQDVKESDTASISAQLSIAEKRRMFSKPKPSLSQAAQSIHRPLNESELDVYKPWAKKTVQ